VCVCVSVRELREYMIRIAQVEFEALSHRFPRDHTKYFLGFQCLGYYLGFKFLSSRVVLSLLCFVVDNQLSALPLVLTRVILLPQRREYGSICDAKANIYTYIYI